VRLGRVAKLAWKTVWLHRLRSFLTVLGIVFGVLSVVAMLAIGEGASQEAQEQIQRMGSRNLLLSSVSPPEGGAAGAELQRTKRYGLTREDLRRVEETIPDVTRIVARRDAPAEVRHGTRKYDTVIVGTEPAYADVSNLRVRTGRFLSPVDVAEHRAVVVLGDEVASRLFLASDPVGRTIRAGTHYYEVVGVLARRGEGTGGVAGVGGESDSAAFIPLTTMNARYGDIVVTRSAGNMTREEIELHRITVEAGSLDDVGALAGALRTLVARWHPRDDVRLTVPLELLRQARETKRIWTTVLALIAGISLLVGGIGIMNIMLASVVERTREVGIRRALGARKRHIVLQFLAETVLLSITGGLIGLGLGIVGPMAVTSWTGMRTVVTPFSLVLAFGISAGVGIVFGLYPAVRAAELDPVEALRHE
jgi:putative ABC transport system permease protein